MHILLFRTALKIKSHSGFLQTPSLFKMLVFQVLSAESVFTNVTNKWPPVIASNTIFVPFKILLSSTAVWTGVVTEKLLLLFIFCVIQWIQWIHVHILSLNCTNY